MRVRVRVKVSVAVRVRVKLLAEPHLGQTRPPSTASSAPRAPATRRTLRRRARIGAARATCAKHCRNLGKVVVLTIIRFFELRAYMHEKTSKNAALGPPKPSPERPKPIQNRARSGPRRTKTNQERRQAQPDAQKAPQKRPRAKNSANMSPNEVRKLRIEVRGAPP